MVDFTDTVLYIISILVPAAFAVANYAAKTLVAWLSTKTPFAFLIPEEKVAKALQDAIKYGVQYANQRAKEEKIVVEFDNEFIANAATYVKDSVPDALKRFGITDERLADMVRARLG